MPHDAIVRQQGEVRPALCLTSEIGIYKHVIIVFISSRLPDDLNESDLVIRKLSENSLETGLTVDSVIRLHKIVTIPKSIIKIKLGVINQSVQIEIRKKLRKLFEG